MKIALVYDALFPYVKGGGERRYFELAQRLRDSHDVHMISWQYWPGAARTSVDGVTYHGTGRPPAFYGSDGRRRTAEAISFAAHALPVLLSERFDVIDCASVPFLPLLIGSLASHVRGARLVATWFEFWGAYWLTYRSGVSGHLARVVERVAAEAGDARIAISQTTAQRMPVRARERIPIRVIEPGADINLIRRVPDAEKTIDVVFAGRLSAQKNVPLILKAIAEAERDGSRITCAVIGDGPERGPLMLLARQLAVDDRVMFCGRIEDDLAYYAAIKSARLFVWPSVAEGFGLAPLEAMACGVPPVIVASPFSATQALVQQDETGVIAAAEPASFAQAIRALLDDPARLSRMSAAGVARAEQSTWDKMARAVECVYFEVVSGRDGPA